MSGVSTMSTTELLSISELLNSPTLSTWLRDALTQALKRDPVDAANDAELLSQLLSARCDQLLQQAKR